MRSGLGIFLILSSFVFGPAATAQAPAKPTSAEVEIEYWMGNQAAGEIDARCEGGQLIWPPAKRGSLTLETGGGRLRYFQTWENRTVVGGNVNGGLVHVRGQADSQGEQAWVVPPGALNVQWSKEGEASVLGTRPFTRDMGPFEGRLLTDAWEVTPGVLQLITGEYWVQKDDRIVKYWSPVNQWSRTLTPKGGPLDVTGNVTIYLEGAVVEGPDGFQREVPPWEEIYARTPSEVAGVWTYRYHHALLELSDVRFSVESAGKQLICFGLSAGMNGRFTAYQAEGEARSGNESLPVARQALTLAGTFVFEERPMGADAGSPMSRAPVRFQAKGDFDEIGVDFQRSSLTPEPSQTGLLVAAAAGATAGAWALWKLLVVLFTRLRRERIMSSPTRERLHESIEARPGITLRELQQAMGLGASTLRYQLRVLERHGLVRRFMLGGRLCLAPSNAPLQSVKKTRATELDAPLSELVSTVGPDGILARSAVARVRESWGLSRSGGWKVIDRAVSTDLLRRERLGREVWLWRTP